MSEKLLESYGESADGSPKIDVNPPAWVCRSCRRKRHERCERPIARTVVGEGELKACACPCNSGNFEGD